MKQADTEGFPARPLTLVVSCAKGGGTPDTTARLVADKLGQCIGGLITVKNMPGLGSLAATTEVANSKPDGYSLLFATNSAICFTPLLFKEATYDPMRDFTPIAMLASNPFVLAINSDLPVQNVADLIRVAKGKPKSLSYGSFGMGTSKTFMQLFMKEAGIEFAHVPHPGSAEDVLNDVSEGKIHLSFVDPKVTVEHSFDHVRYIGLSTKIRHPAVPTVPTIAESGLPTYDANSWVSLVAPAGIPSGIAQLLRDAMREVIASPEYNEYLAANGFVALDFRTSEDVTGFFKSEIIKWGSVLRGAGLAAG